MSQHQEIFIHIIIIIRGCFTTLMSTRFLLRLFDEKMFKRVCKCFQTTKLIPSVIANFVIVLHNFIHVLYQNENEF